MAYVLAKRNGKYLENIEYFVCDGEDDLANLPAAPAGSTAHCIAEGTDYLLGSDGTWAKQPQGGGGGGGDVEVEALYVTENGTYTAQAGKAYSPVEVDVPNSYTPADEGKVVDDGALTAQTSLTVTANDTYDTTLVSSVTVNVGGDPPDPTDGKTHIWINIPENTPADYMTFYVRFKQSEADAVTVDWGDGTTAESWTGTSASNRSHTYAEPGDYEITMACGTGKTYGFVGSSNNSIYGATSNTENQTRVKRIFFGTGVTEIGEYAVYKSYALRRVTLPTGITSIGSNAFNSCYALQSVTIPPTVTSIGASAFQYCNALPSITIPSGVTSIGTYVFHSCYALQSISIPSSVTSIGNSAFIYDYSLSKIHIAATSPPTLGTNVFSSTPRDLVIYVPFSADHSVLNAYKNETNWSSYASKMVEEPA